ncbi:hypothetical protein F2P81_001849 [Scophthalmus maximus]|uniref:Src kinase-associated phosphoprotein 2 n=1 Tax=Scophthalmus maximus TaxID=52904 RepID=A0A6A4TP68_SCOMX|nr:hypothetical protein F2P81_001849 [Scophthalmus maximus]
MHFSNNAAFSSNSEAAYLEHFLSHGLKGENLSKRAKERREAFVKRIKEVKLSFPHEFKDKTGGDDSEEEEEVDSNNDGGSLQSERTDKDDDACEDHSFFGIEWQKRWCVLSHHTFYYYGSEKDKQQKGEFCTDGYAVKLSSTLRRDSKKDCCFEISAPDKRVYQFCASSAKEAEEWVKQIDVVLRDIVEEEDQETYDDIDTSSDRVEPEPIDEDIYEELPEDDMPIPAQPPLTVAPSSRPPPPAAADKSTDYQNYYQGLWDCERDLPDELSFKRGDAIYILSKSLRGTDCSQPLLAAPDPPPGGGRLMEYQSFGWWVGEKNGNIGIVPKDYLMELYAL